MRDFFSSFSNIVRVLVSYFSSFLLQGLFRYVNQPRKILNTCITNTDLHSEARWVMEEMNTLFSILSTCRRSPCTRLKRTEESFKGIREPEHCLMTTCAAETNNVTSDFGHFHRSGLCSALPVGSRLGRWIAHMGVLGQSTRSVN